MMRGAAMSWHRYPSVPLVVACLGSPVAGIRRIRHQLLASVKPSKQSCPFFFKNRPTVTGEEQRDTHEWYMTQCQNR